MYRPGTHASEEQAIMLVFLPLFLYAKRAKTVHPANVNGGDGSTRSCGRFAILFSSTRLLMRRHFTYRCTRRLRRAITRVALLQSEKRDRRFNRLNRSEVFVARGHTFFSSGSPMRISRVVSSFVVISCSHRKGGPRNQFEFRNSLAVSPRDA